MSTIGITGSTGRLGGRVAALLGSAVSRLIVRDAARAPQVEGDPQVAVAEYGDADAARDAFAGLDVLLLVSAAESQDRVQQHRTAVSAAAEAGVGHIVYTSFDGAAADAEFTLGRDHWHTEQAIRESGTTFTILRDSFYLDFFPLFADDAGVIRGPAGAGRVAAVARDDVADVAAAVLRQPAAHAEATYTLTGPEALSFAAAAARMTAALGRPYSYVDESAEEAYASRRALTGEQWQLDAWVSTYTAVASDRMAQVSDDVPRLLGRPARTLEQALTGS